jgi:hypothetical protein
VIRTIARPLPFSSSPPWLIPRNGNFSILYYRTLSFFGFHLKKRRFVFFAFLNTKSLSNLVEAVRMIIEAVRKIIEGVRLFVEAVRVLAVVVRVIVEG